MNLAEKMHVNLPMINHELISPAPPWMNLTFFFIRDFTEQPASSISDNMVRCVFTLLLETKFKNFTQIYTDGSCIIKVPKRSAKQTKSAKVSQFGSLTENVSQNETFAKFY